MDIFVLQDLCEAKILQRKLHDAASHYDENTEATIKRLVQQGASVNAYISIFGLPLSPLEMACSRCLPETVKTLLDHGASLNSRQNTTPLLVFTIIMSKAKTTDASSVAESRLITDTPGDVTKVLEVLLQAGSDINQQDDADGNTALLTAVDIDDVDVVDYLITHGADVNIRNEASDTALMIAAERGNTKIAEYTALSRNLAFSEN